MKKENGITLIALIITIIVMLILVGVSVTVALNGGLFSTAKQATNKTQLELDKEQLLMAAIGAFDDNGKVDFAKLDANLPEGFTKTAEKTYTSKAGNTFTVSEYGSVTEVTDGEGGSGQYTAYSIGQEVIVGGENFYVIEESGSSTPTVTLLAKYCLNSSGVQENITYYSLGRSFSSTNYWSSETEYPVDLNEYPIPEGVASLVKTAKEYGAAKGGTGRLMTKEEAETLATNYEGIILGTDIGATDGKLYYWLGSAKDSTWIYAYQGGALPSLNSYSSPMPCGIRPVIEISKDLVTNIPEQPEQPEQPEEPAYSVGDAIEVEGENFYIIGISETAVTLLAKDCINTSTLEQGTSANTIAFSTELYWESGTDIVEPEPTLNAETGKLTLPDSHTVAKAAYDYGAKVGGTGRLLKHSEATTLIDSGYSNIIYGTNGKSSSSGLNYFLGTSSGSFVWRAFGASNSTNIGSAPYTVASGVRPVVEIPISDIS